MSNDGHVVVTHAPEDTSVELLDGMLVRKAQWSASCYGKAAARIPAPERHGGLTVAATKEREVDRSNNHGSA